MKRAVADRSLTDNPKMQILYENKPDIIEPYIDVIYSKNYLVKKTLLSFFRR